MQALKHILYFADGEFGPTRAFRRAVALAREHDARLTLMDVTIESGIGADLVKRFGLADDVQQSEQRLYALADLAEEWVRGQAPRLRVTIGTPFIEVIQAVLRDGHDLVLKPVRQRPGCRGLFASTDMHLLRKCPCPVWIDREPEDAATGAPAVTPDDPATHSCTRVLAAVDAAQPDSRALNRRILDTAAAVAARDGAMLDVVHAWQAPFDGALPGTRTEHDPRLADALGLIERQHAAALAEVTGDYRTQLRDGATHLVRGTPAEQVLAQARRLASDLIVLATLSRPREPGLFIGTTAEDLLQGAETSVLALKPAGFVSPVG
ncbi:universal stress protein [uncultured Thiohalocapsa sp.]|uniref:universal stress protein n=1 Tax=uncultured Thiohalocapsa sp. TaxID=768990 RepID=UPI0025F74A8B|nr:universal stress protein [uncultured Thiohalocapsa sp.]